MPQKRAESSPPFKAESVILGGFGTKHRRRRQSARSRLSPASSIRRRMRQSGRWTRQYRHLAVYRRDQDVPPWTGLPTAGCHLALVRRVVERRADVQLVTYSRGANRAVDLALAQVC